MTNGGLNQPARDRGGLSWHTNLRRYLIVSAFSHLVWEFIQLPLYTLWRAGSAAEIAYAVMHCTAGDIVIAATAVVLALAAVGSGDWPRRGFASVWVVCVLLGVGYTVYSEHINTAVRGVWAYSALMPVVPWIGTGVAPLLQWLVIPTAALWYGAGVCPTGRLSKFARPGRSQSRN